MSHHVWRGIVPLFPRKILFGVIVCVCMRNELSMSVGEEVEQRKQRRGKSGRPTLIIFNLTAERLALLGFQVRSGGPRQVFVHILAQGCVCCDTIETKTVFVAGYKHVFLQL